MKHIRIKIKTLLMLSVAILMVAFYADNIFWWGVGIYNSFVPDENEINIMYMSTDKVENENRRLELILSEHDYDLYDLVWIEDGATSSGTHIRSLDSKKVYDQFIGFSEKEDLYAKNPEYALNVGLMQWFGGEAEKAKLIMKSIDPENLKGEMADEYYLIQAGIGLTYHDMEVVMVSIDRISQKEYLPLVEKIKEFVALFYMENIDYEKADIKYKAIKDSRYIGYYSEMLSLIDISTSEGRKQSGNYYSKQPNRNLYGSVTRNGEPLEGVFLYEDIDSGMSSGNGFDRRVFITDDEGRYEINGLNTETKRIGLAIPWQLIHDQQWVRSNEVDASTEKVDYMLSDGARFKKLSIEDNHMMYEIYDSVDDPSRMYMMKIRSTDPDYNINGSTIDWEIKSSEMSGKIPLEEIIKRSGFSHSYSSSDDELDIKRFFEPLYLTDEYYFEIMPFNEDRKHYTSNGLFSDALAASLEVEGQEAMSEGDVLLSEGKIEEAMEWYDVDGSQHSLKVLTALYTRGFIPAEEDVWQWELGGSDHYKAADYLERLILTSGETNDRLRQLARQYKESFQFEKEEEILTKLNENLKQVGSETVYVELSIARNLIFQGEYMKGTSRYYEVGDPMIDGDRYFAYFIMGMRTELLPTEYAEKLLGVEGLNEYESFNYMIAEGRYMDAWEWLESKPNSDIKTFYRLLMLDRLNLKDFSFKTLKAELGLEDKDRFIDYYVRETKEMKNHRLEKILRMLKKDSNWFE